MERIFVTGIGTGVGKTVVSAILTEALQADYWKPVQTGLTEGTDSETIRNLVTNRQTVIHPEAYCLKLPASPHAAAAEEGVAIQMKGIVPPLTANNLVIEGAGGLMVPLNFNELMIHLIEHLDASVVLVVRHYLGSINHTLLSIDALKARKMKIKGIVYSGATNEQSEKAICAFGSLPVLGRIREEKSFTPAIISAYAKEFRHSLANDTLVKGK